MDMRVMERVARRELAPEEATDLLMARRSVAIDVVVRWWFLAALMGALACFVWTEVIR